MSALPDPALDWAAFLSAVEALNKDMVCRLRIESIV